MKFAQSFSNFLQLWPQFRGKRRISRLLLRIFGFSQKKNLVIRTKSGRFTLPNLLEIVSFDLFVNGEYEKGLVRLISANLPQNGVFVDVGANIGSICVPLALSRPDAHIVAVEASPWIYEILASNIRQNEIRNIHAINNAVYFESGKTMRIYAPKDLFGKGSLNPIFTKDGEAIVTITVDDIINSQGLRTVHFVKVDVEGFELCVFKGMNAVIDNHRPKIVFEFADWTESTAGFEIGAAQAFLLEKGYNLERLDNDFVPLPLEIIEIIKKNSVNLLAS